jgi:hypothetical protein
MPRRHASPETAVYPSHRAHCSEKLKARPPTHNKTPGQSHPASVAEFGIRRSGSQTHRAATDWRHRRLAASSAS